MSATQPILVMCKKFSVPHPTVVPGTLKTKVRIPPRMRMRPTSTSNYPLDEITLRATFLGTVIRDAKGVVHSENYTWSFPSVSCPRFSTLSYSFEGGGRE